MEGLSVGDNVVVVFGETDNHVIVVRGQVLCSSRDVLQVESHVLVDGKARIIYICEHKVLYYYIMG